MGDMFFWLDLRQYKNDYIQSKNIPVLKLPPFFLRRIGDEKQRQFQNRSYIVLALENKANLRKGFHKGRGQKHQKAGWNERKGNRSEKRYIPSKGIIKEKKLLLKETHCIIFLDISKRTNMKEALTR